MEEKREYIATYIDSCQISPDDFATYYPTLKLSDETTIGEIRQWFSGKNKAIKMELTIIEL